MNNDEYKYSGGYPLSDRLHILICGKRQAGKTTLINRVIQESGLPVYGYRTQMERSPEDGFGHVYIYPADNGEHSGSEDNEIGVTQERIIRVNPGVLNGLGCKLLGTARNDGMIVMDEIGYMEDRAEDFCRSVTAAFNGDIPVLASIKDTEHQSGHIHSILNHPKARVYMLNKENRDEVYRTVKKVVEEWKREITGKGEEGEI